MPWMIAITAQMIIDSMMKFDSRTRAKVMRGSGRVRCQNQKRNAYLMTTATELPASCTNTFTRQRRRSTGKRAASQKKNGVKIAQVYQSSMRAANMPHVKCCPAWARKSAPCAHARSPSVVQTPKIARAFNAVWRAGDKGLPVQERVNVRLSAQ